MQAGRRRHPKSLRKRDTMAPTARPLPRPEAVRRTRRNRHRSRLPDLRRWTSPRPMRVVRPSTAPRSHAEPDESTLHAGSASDHAVRSRSAPRHSIALTTDATAALVRTGLTPASTGRGHRLHCDTVFRGAAFSLRRLSRIPPFLVIDDRTATPLTRIRPFRRLRSRSLASR